MHKPNILFVFSDQHRWCDLGCYGNAEVLTPNFDAFAKKAAVFTNCIANSPVCVPSRGSLMTGLYPNNHRAVTNDLKIDSGRESIASVMNGNGYHTGYIGKWHLGGIPRDKPIRQGERLGFHEWKAYNCNHDYYAAYYYDENNVKFEISGYEPAAQTNMAIDFIGRNQDRQWALVVSYGAPHDPYFKVPDKYFDRYRDKALTLRENVPGRISNRKTSFLTKEQMRENYKGYYAHITALDEQFGRLMESLEQSGQLDNTLVIYTSDHGDMLGSQGLTFKQLPYNESVKVPLMIYCKGKTVPVMSGEIISLTDLPVSILGLLGMTFSGQTDGQDLSELFTNPNGKGAECAYMMDLVPCHQAYHRGYPEWRGIKTKKHTYARSFDSSFAVLFDDDNDPMQTKNLIADSALKDPLEAKLLSLAEQYDEFLPWDTFIKKHGYTQAWNESQRYFGLPLLENKTKGNE